MPRKCSECGRPAAWAGRRAALCLAHVRAVWEAYGPQAALMAAVSPGGAATCGACREAHGLCTACREALA